MIKEINERRSIRTFGSKSVTREQIIQILEAGILAPSGKNLQPWRFDVITKLSAREKISKLLAKGADRLEQEGKPIGTNRNTSRVVLEAPVFIGIFNAEKEDDPLSNLESIGASIQNMCLEAQSMGLGTLWICDIECCMEEITKYFAHGDLPMVAGLAIGYPAEAPKKRPRKKLEEVTRFDPLD